MAEQGVPKKKRRRYSREPDLEVLVEEETFHVHSRDLMGASDVFASMLESDMREVEEGRIVLPGKSKEEFRTLMQHISVTCGAATPDITKNSVEFLLRWADEYQIVGLVARCEKFLQDEMEMSFSGEKELLRHLHLASEYKLEGLQEQALNKLATDVYEYRYDIVNFIDKPSIMKVLLPTLFKEARMTPPLDLPTAKVEARELWPFVARSLELMNMFNGMNRSRGLEVSVGSLRAAILDEVRADESAEGVDLNTLFQKVAPAPQAQVREVVDGLIGDGEIFCTVDDEHFSAVR